ncbi:putative reverse transcriptase domain-containing protein [Tanacetum coccineum]|uniref:Reverse transcriptase domain-containing protein n=1 Tax=Tanacetum coccineum TaxID=301880 RepID=A0ABQ4XF88_9ASTR
MLNGVVGLREEKVKGVCLTGLRAEINECIAYADALRAEGIDARVVVETVAREEAETSVRDMVKVRVDRVMHLVVSDDNPGHAQEEGAVEVIESIQRDQGHMIVATGQQSAVQLERITELERDNTRLRGMLDFASQRVTRFQHRELRVQREMRQIWRLQFYGRVWIGRNEGVNGNGNDDGNGGRNGNENGNGNGGGNGYENHNVNFGGFRPVARECTYQDFLKCQPLNFKGMEGVVGLTRWFDKIETVFHISNCPQKNQVKYAACTLLDSALTWWNTYKRMIGIEAAYAMTWT